MAATEDAESKELNSIFQILGERNIYKKCKGKYDSLVVFLENFSRLYSIFNEPLCKVYGSVAEELNAYTCGEIWYGDIDLMIIPTSNDLMIHEELIEYLPESPVHVRIKGALHPVLQSCLEEDTEYVAASAIKSFHPAVYGPFNLVFSPFPALTSQIGLVKPLTMHTKNRYKSSPALTIEMGAMPFDAEPFQTLMGDAEPQGAGRITGNATDFSAEAAMCDNPKQCVKSENCHKEESGSTLMSGSHVNPRNEVSDQVSAATKRQFSRRESLESSHQVPEKKTFMQVIEGEEADNKIDDNDNGNSTKNRKQPRTEMETQKEMCKLDFVPALRFPGWPKVAQEWIKRERKWPSPEIVEKVIQEGVHLVVKPLTNGDNPNCHFRISFSHAEYLLSQEMNDIQRECYRCLKKLCREYLSTKPKGLVSYHLKNVFLQTIEETGAELWTDSNRVECIRKLLGNLLKALTKKNLPHFFVRTYNLFCIDYIEGPAIMELLAVKIEQIMENLIGFAKELVQKQEFVDKEYRPAYLAAIAAFPDPLPDPLPDALQDAFSTFLDVLTPKSLTGPSLHEELEETALAQEAEEQVVTALKKIKASMPLLVGNLSMVRGFLESKDLFLAIIKELTDIAFNNDDCSLKDLDPVERCIVENLKELFISEELLQDGFFFEMLHSLAFFNIRQNPEPDIRRRVLDGIQGVLKFFNNFFRKFPALTLPSDHSETAIEVVNVLKTFFNFMVQNAEVVKHIFLGLSADSWAESGTTQSQEADVNEIPLD